MNNGSTTIRFGGITHGVSLALQQLLQADAAFGWSALVESSGPATQPQLQLLDGRVWLQSRSLRIARCSGPVVALKTDVTDSIQRQRQFQWLLVASAGSRVAHCVFAAFGAWRVGAPVDQLNSKVTAAGRQPGAFLD